MRPGKRIVCVDFYSDERTLVVEEVVEAAVAVGRPLNDANAKQRAGQDRAVEGGGEGGGWVATI